MNLRPPGYEPGELPDCSTPRRFAHYSAKNRLSEPARRLLAPLVASIDEVIAFWAALAFLVVAFVAGVAFLAVRALETRRALKSLRSALAAELQRIARSGERTTGELEDATRAFERLQASLVRFRTVYARVRLIRSVLAEAEAVLARARAFAPSK